VTEAVLAIDLGTSSIKALLVDQQGSVIARDRVAHSTFRPAPGAAEQAPDVWWANVRQIIDRLAAEHMRQVRISAISVTGQMHGLVLHDDLDQPLRSTITWQDRRSTATLPDLLDRLSLHHHARADSSIAPGYQVASWHWLSVNDPDLLRSTRRLLLPKDEIIFRLTGRHVTDPSDAVGTGLFDETTSGWDQSVMDAASIPANALPGIVPSGSVVGTVLPEVSAELGVQATTAVIIAGGDAAIAAFGAGVVRPDQSLLMLSTGCQVLQPLDRLPATLAHDSMCWPSANPARLPSWLRIAATLNGGNTIDWAHRALAHRSNDEERKARSRHDDPGPVFIPYLDGERAPVSAASGSGAFVGLSTRHDAGAMIQAVIDGVTLGVADIAERMSVEIGTDQPVLVGGGGVHNPRWLEAMARIFARPLDVIAEPDLSAWGAARSAATTFGWIDHVADPACWLPPVKRILPASSDPVAARERLASFRRTANAVASVAGDQRQ
jgi:xylulokinase